MYICLAVVSYLGVGESIMALPKPPHSNLQSVILCRQHHELIKLVPTAQHHYIMHTVINIPAGEGMKYVSDSVSHGVGSSVRSGADNTPDPT